MVPALPPKRVLGGKAGFREAQLCGRKLHSWWHVAEWAIVAQAAAACGLGGAGRRAAVHLHLGPSELWLSPALVGKWPALGAFWPQCCPCRVLWAMHGITRVRLVITGSFYQLE